MTFFVMNFVTHLTAVQSLIIGTLKIKIRQQF